MNIPGPIKTNEKIRAAFDIGKNLIFKALADADIAINDKIETHENTGDEILISVSSTAPEKLKDIAVKIEQRRIHKTFSFTIILLLIMSSVFLHFEAYGHPLQSSH